MAKKHSIGESCGGCLVLVVLTGFGMSYMKGCVDGGFEAVERKREQDAIVEQKLDAEMPKGTEERLRHDITATLGTSNRNVQRTAVDVTARNVAVQVGFNDNLTEGMIRGGIQMDVTDVLKAAANSGYDFSEIRISGSFPLSDKFGNSTESDVARLRYSRSTVDRINWDNFLFDNVFEIADDVWLHPAIREK